MAAMAVIGITSCRKLEDYRQAVLHVSGEVRILEPTLSATEALQGVDGLLLSGGGDLAPDLYGEKPHATVEDVDAERDRFQARHSAYFCHLPRRTVIKRRLWWIPGTGHSI